MIDLEKIDLKELHKVQSALQNKIDSTSKQQSMYNDISNKLVGKKGLHYFNIIAKKIASHYKLECVGIGLLTDENCLQINPLYVNGFTKNITHTVKESPFEQTLKEGAYTYSKGLSELYPKNELIADLHAISYTGIALRSIKGKNIGIFFAYSHKELDLSEDFSFFFRIIGELIIKEVERCKIIKCSDDFECNLANIEVEKLSVAVEQNPATIVITDTTGKIEYANPRFTELTGYSVNEVIGKNPRVLKSGKTSKATIKELWDTINEGKIWKGEFINLKKNGDEFVESATIAPIFDNKEKIQSFVAIKEDITKRKQAEQALAKSEMQLKELNATKDKFFSIISHDLKNPFNTIMGFSELLNKHATKYDADKIKLFAQNIHNSSKQAHNLLVNLLEWSRLQTGKLKPNPSTIKTKQLLCDVALLCRPLAEVKGIELIIEKDEKTAIYADIEMIKTVLRNLITNAIKFTHRKGKVCVTTNQIGNTILFSVNDTGIGIKKELHSQLFRIDSKMSREGTANESGTGLGLILCKEFVTKNGGKIWVESKEKEEGSLFKFTIPANQE